MTTHTPECHCLNCFANLSAATGVGHEDPPVPGNLTVCLRCGAVMKIADDLTVRGLTEEEMDLLCADHAMMKYLRKLVIKIQLMPKMN